MVHTGSPCTRLRRAPRRGPRCHRPAGPDGSGRAPTRAQLALVGVVAAAGGIAGAVLADASPTSWPLADAIERGLLVALCSLAGSRARRWTLVWAAVVVVVCGGDTSRALGAVALAGALALLLVLKRRGRVEGAVLGALLGWCVLDLTWPEPTGATALAALRGRRPPPGLRRPPGRAAGPADRGVDRGGSRGAGGRGPGRRRRLRCRPAGGGAGRGGPDPGRGGLGGLGRRRPDQGPFRVRRRLVRRTSPSEASAWWLAPARALPLVGPNLELARTAAGTGADLNLAAADLSESVDQDALRRAEGGIDLAVLAAMDDPVSRAGSEIDRATTRLDEADSPWLLPPVRNRFEEFRDELAATARSTELADLAVQRAPDLLGASGPRRYLLLLGNPAEARDLGGHIGNWAEIVAADGTLSLVDVGSPYELFSPSTVPAPTLTPGAYPQSLVEMRPQVFPQNWGATADFPTVARLAAELYPQARPGAPIDGVIYADPAAFAALLRITGPVAVPGTQTTLTPDNAVQFLTKDQFGVIPTDRPGLRHPRRRHPQRRERVHPGQAPRPDGSWPTPSGRWCDQGRLQFASLRPEDAPLLDAVGLQGKVERPGEGDLLAVLTRNANPSKVDAYLERDVDYDVSWDPSTGRERATVTIRMTNTAPVGQVPDVVVQPPVGAPAGTNRTQLSVLSPLGATGASIDGTPTGIGTQQELAGVLRHSVLLDIPPGRVPGGHPGAWTARWGGAPTCWTGSASRW